MFLAVVLWFVATERTQRNVNFEVRHVMAEIQYINLREDLELALAPATVDVTAEGPRLIIPFQIQDVRAVVDLNNLGPGIHRTPVRVDLPATVTLKSVHPQEVQVGLEQRIQRTFPVTVSVRGVPPGVIVQVGAVEPAEVTVLGSSSAVGKVSSLLAQVDYGANRRRATLVPVDVHGVRVDEVILSFDSVEVTLETLPARENEEPSHEEQRTEFFDEDEEDDGEIVQ